MSDAFRKEPRFLGVESSPAFVRAPEGNGCAGRFTRTLKENLFCNRAALVNRFCNRAALVNRFPDAVTSRGPCFCPWSARPPPHDAILRSR